MFSVICQSHIICSVPSRCNTNWDPCWGTKRDQQKYYTNSSRSWKFWWKILQMFTQFFEFLVGNIVKHCVSWNFWWEILHKNSCVSWIRWWEIIQTNSSLSWNFLVETITKVRVFLDISGETYYKSLLLFFTFLVETITHVLIILEILMDNNTKSSGLSWSFWRMHQESLHISWNFLWQILDTNWKAFPSSTPCCLTPSIFILEIWITTCLHWAPSCAWHTSSQYAEVEKFVFTKRGVLGGRSPPN